METKELKEQIGRVEHFIIKHFDEDGKLGGFAREIAEDQNDPENVLTACVDTCLAVGFILGQLFEVIDPDIQADIETFRSVTREKGLLPYLPREKKAA